VLSNQGCNVDRLCMAVFPHKNLIFDKKLTGLGTAFKIFFWVTLTCSSILMSPVMSKYIREMNGPIQLHLLVSSPLDCLGQEEIQPTLKSLIWLAQIPPTILLEEFCTPWSVIMFVRATLPSWARLSAQPILMLNDLCHCSCHCRKDVNNQNKEGTL